LDQARLHREPALCSRLRDFLHRRIQGHWDAQPARKPMDSVDSNRWLAWSAGNITCPVQRLAVLARFPKMDMGSIVRRGDRTVLCWVHLVHFCLGPFALEPEVLNISGPSWPL